MHVHKCRRACRAWRAVKPLRVCPGHSRRRRETGGHSLSSSRWPPTRSVMEGAPARSSGTAWAGGGVAGRSGERLGGRHGGYRACTHKCQPPKPHRVLAPRSGSTHLRGGGGGGGRRGAAAGGGGGGAGPQGQRRQRRRRRHRRQAGALWGVEDGGHDGVGAAGRVWLGRHCRTRGGGRCTQGLAEPPSGQHDGACTNRAPVNTGIALPGRSPCTRVCRTALHGAAGAAPGGAKGRPGGVQGAALLLAAAGCCCSGHEAAQAREESAGDWAHDLASGRRAGAGSGGSVQRPCKGRRRCRRAGGAACRRRKCAGDASLQGGAPAGASQRRAARRHGWAPWRRVGGSGQERARRVGWVPAGGRAPDWWAGKPHGGAFPAQTRRQEVALSLQQTLRSVCRLRWFGAWGGGLRGVSAQGG